jgi:hypothetical protein
VIFPWAIEVQVVFGKSLHREAEALEKVSRPKIARHVVCHDSVKIHAIEGKIDHRPVMPSFELVSGKLLSLAAFHHQ